MLEHGQWEIRQEKVSKFGKGREEDLGQTRKIKLWTVNTCRRHRYNQETSMTKETMEKCNREATKRGKHPGLKKKSEKPIREEKHH